MSAPLEQTRYPGIYRRGGRYLAIYRDNRGRQRSRSAATLGEAKAIRKAAQADVVRGEYRALARVTFAEYAPDWIASYAGRTTRGFREETRREYRRDLGLDDDGQPLDPPRGAVAFFGRMLLAEVEPRDVKRYAAKLAASGLSAGSIRNAIAPVRACLATAVEDGLIRSNPAAGVRIPRSSKPEPEQEQAKALTDEELRKLLAKVAPQHRLLVEFLAHTGMRISELIALRWEHIDFGRRRVLVRVREYHGLDAPKSRHGRRDVPLSEGMARSLWNARKASRFPADDDPVFASGKGTPLVYSNLYRRVLKPTAVSAGVPWAGFHTLRHTCATALFRRGLNAKQVQAWLGHHSPAFTLATYVHLLPDDLPQPDFLDALTAEGGSRVAARQAETGRDAGSAESAFSLQTSDEPRQAETA